MFQTKFQHVSNIQIIPRLLIWCWRFQSVVFKLHVCLKKVCLSFIKRQLLFFNHRWERSYPKSYLLGTFRNSQETILEYEFCKYCSTLHRSSDSSSLDLHVDIYLGLLIYLPLNFYYLDNRNVTNNKLFCETVKPFFWDKGVVINGATYISKTWVT